MNNLIDFLQTHEEAFRSRARLASLYSDFRLQRSTNPDGYAANSSAWLHALSSASRAGLLPLGVAHGGQSSHLAFSSGDELASALQSSQYGRPLALGAVIQDAVDRRELVPLQEFLSAQKSVYSRNWAPSPWGVISWGLRQLGVGADVGRDKLAVGKFVVVGNVEAAADAIQKKVTQLGASPTSLIYTRQQFETDFSHVLSNATDSASALSSTDFSILLTYLSRDRPVLSQDGQTVKFATPGDPAPTAITSQDSTIAQLRALIASLKTQTETLTERIAALQSSIRASIASQQSATAKQYLRQRRLAETTLQTRQATLAQLEDVFQSIEQAADNVAIMRVMRDSTQVIRRLNKEAGGTEGAEDVLEGLRTQMDEAQDINTIVNEAAASGASAVDEGEVEEELEALERSEREKREKAEADATRRRLEELEKADVQKQQSVVAATENEQAGEGGTVGAQVMRDGEPEAAQPVAQDAQ